MTHRAVEIVLGRLATDEAIRRRFRQAPAITLTELIALGLELSPVERAALEALDPAAIQQFAESVSSRLQKAELLAEPGCKPHLD